jgi:hypothetical protein
MLATYLIRQKGGVVVDEKTDIGQLHTPMMQGEVKELADLFLAMLFVSMLVYSYQRYVERSDVGQVRQGISVMCSSNTCLHASPKHTRSLLVSALTAPVRLGKMIIKMTGTYAAMIGGLQLIYLIEMCRCSRVQKVLLVGGQRKR